MLRRSLAAIDASPLTQGRGLKHPLPSALIAAAVAPHAGAWIETRKCRGGRGCERVAPHAGAWIET